MFKMPSKATPNVSGSMGTMGITGGGEGRPASRGPSSGSLPSGASARPAAHGKTNGSVPAGNSARPAARGKTGGKLPTK